MLSYGPSTITAIKEAKIAIREEKEVIGAIGWMFEIKVPEVGWRTVYVKA